MYHIPIFLVHKFPTLVRPLKKRCHCEQQVAHNCTHSPLTGHSWWTDRNDEKRSYWHGNYSNGQNGCQCSLTNSGCTANVHGDQVYDQTPAYTFNKNMFLYIRVFGYASVVTTLSVLRPFSYLWPFLYVGRSTSTSLVPPLYFELLSNLDFSLVETHRWTYSFG